jgi:hypothetical protein
MFYNYLKLPLGKLTLLPTLDYSLRYLFGSSYKYAFAEIFDLLMFNEHLNHHPYR